MKSLEKWMTPFKRTERAPTRRGGDVDRNPIAQVRREMDRLFDRMLSDPFGEMADRWYGDFSPARFLPTIDIVDEKSHLRVTAELPGMGRDDVKLEILQDTLRIRGEKKSEEIKDEEGYYRTERVYGSFERIVPLPVDVDAERAEATFDKGVLTVKLPKIGGAPQSRSIPIRTT